MDCTDIDKTKKSWTNVTDIVILQIFQYISSKSPYTLLKVGKTCKLWNRLSYDDSLWRPIIHKEFNIDPKVETMPENSSWYKEYKRLVNHVPRIQTEILKEHDKGAKVLHVSFSHDGELFATCCADGFIKVWTSSHPCKIKYSFDMKTFSLFMTEYSQFNENDTLLLVSSTDETKESAFSRAPSLSGEIAVFSLVGGFILQCRIVNRPHDLFGAWYSEEHLICGNLHYLKQHVSSSKLWLNKAYQDITTEHIPMMVPLFQFYNTNISTKRHLLIANCVTPQETADTDEPQVTSSSPSTSFEIPPVSGHSRHSTRHNTTLRKYPQPVVKKKFYNNEADSIVENMINDNSERRDAINDEDSEDIDFLGIRELFSILNDAIDLEYQPSEFVSYPEGMTVDVEGELSKQPDKYLIFTTGSKSYVPHEIGFKRIKKLKFQKKLNPKKVESSLVETERVAERALQIDWLNYDSVAQKFDKLDHVIDLHGHIFGMKLSPDHRYLYVNSRAWPEGYTISNPHEPPPIAREFDIHVIDMATLQKVGTMLRSHQAYSNSIISSLIFLDVSDDYVASGAEDRHGYIWDRHYGCSLYKYPHLRNVSCVAFNPKDPGMLVTTSDLGIVKVWRSISKSKEIFSIKQFEKLTKAVSMKTKKSKARKRRRMSM